MPIAQTSCVTRWIHPAEVPRSGGWTLALCGRRQQVPDTPFLGGRTRAHQSGLSNFATGRRVGAGDGGRVLRPHRRHPHSGWVGPGHRSGRRPAGGSTALSRSLPSPTVVGATGGAGGIGTATATSCSTTSTAVQRHEGTSLLPGTVPARRAAPLGHTSTSGNRDRRPAPSAADDLARQATPGTLGTRFGVRHTVLLHGRLLPYAGF